MAAIVRRVTFSMGIFTCILLLASVAQGSHLRIQLELIASFAVADVSAASVGCDLKVSENGRFLVRKSDGKAFYFLGDTAWELIYNLTREEVIRYLDDRAAKKFTAIQSSLVSIFKGTGPNAQGDSPFSAGKPLVTPGNSPDNAAEYDFWDHVEFIAAECARRGMYLSVSTTWSNNQGAINNPTPFEYGKFLGNRFKHVPNIIWVTVGDAGNPGDSKWGEVAKGIAVGVSGTEDYSSVLVTFHPAGPGTTEAIHGKPWMSFNLIQSGQDPANLNSKITFIPKMYGLTPPKPVMDYEPNYEGIWGKVSAFDIRRANWWTVFAGAFGHTYGHPCLFQMWKSGKQWDGCTMTWEKALNTPGSAQMQHLRNLIESRPMLSRVPDQSLVTSDLGVSGDHIKATRGEGYAFIYAPTGKSFTVRMGKISGSEIKAWWFNPKNGEAVEIGVFPNSGTREFTPPSSGNDNDWALVLDDAAKGFGKPGVPLTQTPATVAVPVIKPEAATHYDSVVVSISCATADAVIYYTTDKSEPSSGSTAYTKPFTITESTTIKAIAVKDSASSGVAQMSYTIKKSVSVPVFRSLNSALTPQARGSWIAYRPNGRRVDFNPAQTQKGLLLLTQQDRKLVKKVLFR